LDGIIKKGKSMIGKLKKVPLREIWEHEAHNFTIWLAENIDVVNEVLGLKLTVIARENKVGPFSADIVAEDENGRNVIIENQLEKTDHDHLGKLVTYLSNINDAKTAIWISSNPVEEHENAIKWLNGFTPDDVCFYLLKIEAVQIGASDHAPLITIIAQPTEFAKEVGKEKKEIAESNLRRKEFWTELLEKARERTKLYINTSPGIYSWIGAGAGKAGVNYNLSITNTSGQAEIYMDRGKDFPEINKERFDKLYLHKTEIEKSFGGKLNWERLENRRASRISYRVDDGGLAEKEKWAELQDKLIDAIIRLEKATKSYIRDLK